MAKVPIYDSQQIRPVGMPAANVPASNTIAQVGATAGRELQNFGTAMLQGGNAVAQIIVQQHEQEDADTLMQAEATLKQKYLDYEIEARKRNGVEAWDITKDTEKWWSQAEKENAPKFKTQRAARAYAGVTANLRLQSIDSMSRFEKQERDRSLVESANASIAASTNWAAANPTADSISKAEAEIRQRVAIIGNVKGYDADTRKTLADEKIGTLHKQILEGLLSTNPTMAKAYYESRKASFPGADHAEIEHKIELGRAKQLAPELAKQYLASGVQEPAALADLRSKHKNDPNLDLFEREVKQGFAEREKAKRDRVGVLLDNVSRSFAERYRPSDVSASELSELKKLDGSTWAGFKTHMDAKIKSLAGEGSGIKTNYATYNELYEMAGRDPVKFANLPMMSYRSKFKDSDFEEMVRLQLNVRNAIANSNRKSDVDAQKDLQTYQMQLSDVYNLLGWDSKDAEKKGAFAAAARDAISADEARAGRRLTDDERQVLLNKLATKTKTGWFSSTYGYEVKDPTTVSTFSVQSIKDVPVGERQKISAALARAKKPVTDAAVIEMYKRKLGVQ